MTELAAAGSPDELAAVRHLAELGYVDPWETAAQRAAAERDLHATFQRAEELLRSGGLAPAIELLEAATRAAPDWANGRHLLARAYFRAGSLDAAEGELQRLELRAVEHAELAYLRAAIARRRRQWDAAREHAQYAVHLAGALPAAQLIIGESQLRRGEFEEAAALALELIDHDPRQAEPHLLLGRALLGLHRWPEARIALESYIQLRPTQAPPYRWLANACGMSGDPVAAADARHRGRMIVAQRRAARR